MENRSKAIIGTGLKVSIKVDPIGQYHLSDMDFSARFYVGNTAGKTLAKSGHVKVDDDTYIAPVDTNGMRSGTLRCRLTVVVPDGDFPDGKRIEISDMNTNITLEM